VEVTRDIDMRALKGTTDKVAGKAKGAVAEIIGDAKLQEEGKAQQRKGDNRKDEPSDPNPLGNLDKLT
jgi:uncharacterized protein YjbJ (UPF0337 family)